MPFPGEIANDTYDATNHAQKVNIVAGGGNSTNPNGQATMANSAPVVIASNQTSVPVTTSADGTTGSAVPSKGLVVQGSDGTNARNVSVRTDGKVNVSLNDSFGNGISQYTPSDAQSGAPTSSLGVTSFPLVFDPGANAYVRRRGNFDTAALITAVGATTTQTASDQANYSGRGVKVVLDVTTAGTGSITLTIQGKDGASGKYYTVLAGATVTTISTNIYEVFPGATVAANTSANTQLPRVWRVITTANNANAMTYTVGASVIV